MFWFGFIFFKMFYNGFKVFLLGFIFFKCFYNGFIVFWFGLYFLKCFYNGFKWLCNDIETYYEQFIWILSFLGFVEYNTSGMNDHNHHQPMINPMIPNFWVRLGKWM